MPETNKTIYVTDVYKLSGIKVSNLCNMPGVTNVVPRGTSETINVSDVSARANKRRQEGANQRQGPSKGPNSRGPRAPRGPRVSKYRAPKGLQKGLYMAPRAALELLSGTPRQVRSLRQ